jgi:hypothetical protein
LFWTIFTRPFLVFFTTIFSEGVHSPAEPLAVSGRLKRRAGLGSAELLRCLAAICDLLRDDVAQQHASLPPPSALAGDAPDAQLLRQIWEEARLVMGQRARTIQLLELAQATPPSTGFGSGASRTFRFSCFTDVQRPFLSFLLSASRASHGAERTSDVIPRGQANLEKRKEHILVLSEQLQTSGEVHRREVRTPPRARCVPVGSGHLWDGW